MEQPNLSNPKVISLEGILNYLPHRYPFLMIDRVLDYKLHEEITAIKNVSINEHFFQGHFPDKPVVPGVLIIEALAQAAGILAYKSLNKSPKDYIFYLASIEKSRFKKVVVPGDQLLLKIKILKNRSNVWKFSGEAWVANELACYTEVTSVVNPIEPTAPNDKVSSEHASN